MLTARKIRDAKPGAKATILWDSDVKGLGVKVYPTGVKSYVLSYRTGGKKRLATLARCSEIKLRDAREKAGRELVKIRDGEPDPLERRRSVREAPTVADGLDRFFHEYAPARIKIGRMRPNTARDYRYQANKYILPVLGDRKVADVHREHIERMVRPLSNVPRNRVLALTSRLFGLFEIWGWRPQHTNPARGVERAQEEARDRVLSTAELETLAIALNEAAERHPGPVAAIRFAAVTGLRIREVLSIRWDEIDFERRRVTLPQTKSGRRSHDLPEPALDVIGNQPRINSWLFTSGRGHLGYSHTRKVFSEIAIAGGLSDVRLHDLRRTVMTQAAMAGVGTHVLRDLLGHKTTAMADRYVREVGNPVREARQRVGAMIAAAMEGKQNAIAEIQSDRESQ